MADRDRPDRPELAKARPRRLGPADAPESLCGVLERVLYDALRTHEATRRMPLAPPAHERKESG
jgi:hypothetical protein